MKTDIKISNKNPYNFKNDIFYQKLLENNMNPILFHIDFKETHNRIDKPPCYNIKDLTFYNYEDVLSENIKKRKMKKLPLNAGIACKTGKETGFLVLDIDIDFLEKWNEIIKEHGDPKTLKIRTQSDALHYYFKYEKTLPKILKKTGNKIITLDSKAQSIDIRSNGGYVVTPIHHNFENKYKYTIESDEIINPCPKWLKDYIKTYESLKIKKKYETNNKTDLTDLKRILLSHEREHSEIFIKKYKEIIKIINVKEDIVYVWNDDTCLWEEKHGDPFIVNMIVEYFTELFEYVKNNYQFPTDNPKQKENFLKVEKNVLRMTYARGVYQKSITKLFDDTFSEKINNQSDLLPIRDNLIIDLKTCETRSRTKDDMFSFYCPVRLLPSKKIKPAVDVLLKIMKNDNEMLKYLQNVCGYLITGDNSYRAWFLLYGEGCNGKGLLVESLQKILVKEKFFGVGAPEIFLKQDKRKTGAQPELMHLENKRIVNFSETERDEALNEGLIKSISGGDTIVGRNLYKKPHEFTPSCKLVIQTNHLPKFNPDPSMIDRFFPIPFDARFSDDPKEGEYQRDPQLKTKFMTEYLDMFFTWCSIGAKYWYDNKKIIVPDKAKNAKNAYINEMDNVSQYINDRFVLGDDYKISSGALYDDYQIWCNEMGFKNTTKGNLHETFKKKFGEKKKYQGYHYYYGLQFEKHDD